MRADNCAVNGISGASLLYDVGDGDLPLSVAVLLIGIVSIIVGLMGYKVIHAYERWSWIVMLVCFIIVAGFGGKSFVNIPMGVGKAELSSVLSFGTAIIGFEVAWSPIAADYGVFMRETTKEWKSVAWSYGGLFLSQLFIELLGVAVGTLIANPDPIFAAAYVRADMGGLIGACFEGHGSGVRGFGKFIEVILAFSAVSVVIYNIYSLGLSVQMITTKTTKVPRFVWCLLGAVVFLVAAVAGRNHLSAVMSNFLNTCAYWITPFNVIILLEDYIWRRKGGYDLNAYNDKTKLPYGIAASISFVIGTVLSVLCMSQVWWVGPIASAIGGSESGTDISWMLAIVVCTLTYVPMRYLERKKWGY